MAVTIKLKRGYTQDWANYPNPLAQGEPGFELNANRLKIGDGVTMWKDLPYVNLDITPGAKAYVMNAATHFDFPSVGQVDVIYKAQTEKKIYQWNPDGLYYEEVAGSAGIPDITKIDGGTANG